MDKKSLLFMGIFGLIILVAGLLLLVYTNWKIALGVFLVLWGNNIDVGLRIKHG